MKLQRTVLSLALGLAVACENPQDASKSPTGVPSFAASQSPSAVIRINVVLKTSPSAGILADLGRFGTVTGVLAEINGVTMQGRSGDLPAIQALPYVAAAGPDAERYGAPVDAVSVSDFADGLSAWDQDAVNVTIEPLSGERNVDFTGEGVYVGVLDTGLLDSWRQYFPEERIAEEFGIAFSGGGQDQGEVSTQPNTWEHDQNSHGTHVTSTILGYRFRTGNFNGTAPKAIVIPVKVLNQAGFGWSSMIAEGILYVTRLKTSGALGNWPVVINMSLGGPRLDPLEQRAIDHAVANGVVLVASAGNEGDDGMGFPGAYGPVISVAASGWVGEWLACPASGIPGSDIFRNWWRVCDVAEPTSADDFYITDFSSRALAGQDLDVAAPGSWVVGPFQLQSGQTSYFFLGGTSMSSPHVAGIVALMLEKNPGLTAPDVEAILEATAIPLPAGCRTITKPDRSTAEFCWDADATGSGLATADAALAGPQPQKKRRRS